MSSTMRSMPTLRAAQSFSASAVKQPVRRLHITGAKDMPSQFMKPAAASAKSKASKTEPTISRTFNTTRSLKRPNDSSTIDFAFMPSQDILSFAPGSVSTAALNVPILPTTYRTGFASQPAMVAASAPIENIMPEISTVSMALPGQVSVMNETDFGSTHEGREMDVYKIVETVSRKVEEVKEKAEEEVGMMRELMGVMRGMFTAEETAYKRAA